MDALGRLYSFHDLNLEDSLSKTQLPKIERHSNYIFCYCPLPIYGQGKACSKGQPTFYVSGIQLPRNCPPRELEPLLDLFKMCQENPNQRENLMGKEPGYLLHTIIDTLVDDLFHESYEDCGKYRRYRRRRI